MDLLPATSIRHSPGAVSRIAAGETLVLDLASDRFFALDEVGGRIWRLIAEKGTFQGILESVVAEFEVEPDRARVDLGRLLSDLAARDLVRIDGGPG